MKNLVFANVFGSQLSDGLASAPQFGFTNLSKFFLESFTVVRLGVALQGAGGFGTVLDRFVELFKDGLGSIVERTPPVKGTTLGSGRAVGVHPVHTAFTDQGVQRLGGFFDSFVEGFRGRVAWKQRLYQILSDFAFSSLELTVGSQDLVLSLEQTLNGTHQDTTLTKEIRVDFLFKGGLVQVTGTNTDTQGNSTLASLAASILVDCERRVDTTAFLEQTADSETGALGSNQNHINV